MEYEVIIAPRAIKDLQDIVRYVSPDRPEAAKRLALALVEKTKVLAQFPKSERYLTPIIASRAKRANKAPEPTTTSVTPRATERESR
jgi:plasmid stabilization system protein ParE